MNLIYASSEQPFGEEPHPIDMENNESTMIDDSIIIKFSDCQYNLSESSRKELAEMLIRIEKERKTNVIDVESLEAQLISDTDDRKKKIEEFIANSGFSREEFLAVLSSNQSLIK